MKLTILIPAYNEELVIGKVVQQIHQTVKNLDSVEDYELLVVDDGSQDDTAFVAEKAGALVYKRPYNIGNGASVKYGIRHSTGNKILLMDADGQHDPALIPKFVELAQTYDMVVGARTSESVTVWYRDLANKFFNTLATYIVGYPVMDLTSGFRIIDAKIAKQYVYLFPNGFSYPSTVTIALFRSGYSVNYTPIKALSRVGKSKIKLLRDGLGFVLIIFRIGVFFAPLRIFLPLAFLTFMPGFLYAIYRLVFGQPWTLPIVISLSVGTLIMALGIISEQIALLRMQRSS